MTSPRHRHTDSIDSVDHWVADDVRLRRRSTESELPLNGHAHDAYGSTLPFDAGDVQADLSSMSAESSRTAQARRLLELEKEAARDDLRGADAFDLLQSSARDATRRKRAATPVEEIMRKLNVVVLIVETSYGRDKLLVRPICGSGLLSANAGPPGQKCFQYSARTYLWLYLLLSQRLTLMGARPEYIWGVGKRLFRRDRRHLERLNGMVGGLSLARKCLLLFGPLAPLLHLLSPEPLSGVGFFNYTLALLSACADDVYCLSKLGVVSKPTGLWADKWAK